MQFFDLIIADGGMAVLALACGLGPYLYRQPGKQGMGISTIFSGATVIRF